MKHIKLLSQQRLSDEQSGVLNSLAKVTQYDGMTKRDEEEAIARLQDADIALVNYFTPVTDYVLQACPNLRFVVTSTAGVDHIDLAACQARNVRARWFPSYCARTVAERSFAYILMGLNSIVPSIDNARAGQWNYLGFRGREAPGRRLLILGLGEMGSYVRQFAETFGMEVSWTNSQTPAEEVDALIRRADVISLHMSLNDKTRHFLDKRRLGLMKPDVVLVNTARGALLDEEALFEFMAAHPQATALLDVLTQEPPAADYKIHHHKNIIVTPHVTFYSEEAARFLRTSIFEALKSAIDGQWPVSDPKAGWL